MDCESPPTSGKRFHPDLKHGRRGPIQRETRKHSAGEALRLLLNRL
jgi:hypothetical protein